MKPLDDGRGDYLWDKMGAADAEVARLESLVGRLGQSDPPPPLGFAIEIPRPMRPLAAMAMLAAVAIAVLACVAVAWRAKQTSAPGALAGLVVTHNADTDARTSTLKVGGWLSTDKTSATIEVGDIGRVDLDPGSRVTLVSTQPGAYRLRLARGTLHALIWAPPGQFFVDTPSSTAVDLGCAYTLSVGDDGDGLVRVTSGWVGFEWHGRESFIPMGAVCRTRRGLGPGTPHYEDAPERFRAALDMVDFGSGRARETALGTVLESARETDAVSLWHLLTRVPTTDRDRVFDKLASFVPPPAGCTKEGIRGGRRDMLDAWWNKLGLNTASWWRIWEQQWRGAKGDER